MNTTPVFLRRRGLLAAGALAALANLACASAVPAPAELVRVDVLDRDSGAALRVWRDHGGPVVAGRPGARYAVRLANTTGERVLAVVAVDGVNVITGETAAAGQRGYVLGPWQRAEITGWRKSDDEVAAFEFTALSDSYAARTGRPLDVGVIGVAVFREAPVFEVSDMSPSPRPEGRATSKAAPPPALPDARREANAAPAPSADAARSRAPAPAQRLGTGHGAREASVVTTVPFERATARPEQRVAIRYDSLDNLVAAGIVPPPRVAHGGPQPFPADPPRGYVPDPPTR